MDLISFDKLWDTNPDVMRGQTVGLDKFNRVKWSTHFYHPFTNFTDALVLMPAVGATMEKTSVAHWRPRMPDASVRLRSMFEVALGGGYQADDEGGCCFICSSADAPTACRCCPLCLLASHQSCMMALTSVPGLQIVPEPTNLPQFPADFNMCPLCANVAAG